MIQKITLEWVLNGKTLFTETDPFTNVQVLLKKMGILSVRDSDNHSGFAGSDTILLDGMPVNAGLLIAAQLDGHDVVTAEFLADGNSMDPVQAALVDAGAIQSGYNAPAAALILTDLLSRCPDPSKEEIMDAFSGIYFRDNGYVALSKRSNWPSSTKQETERIRISPRSSGMT